MSINVANTAPGMVVLTAGIAIAQRLVQGEWSWTWMAYFWGGVFAFAIIGSALAGLFSLGGYLLGGAERARQARLVQYKAHHINIVLPGKHPPGVGRIVLVPDLAIVNFDVAPEIREKVSAAVEQLRRDVAPGAWAGELGALLSPLLRDGGYEVREPDWAFYWHDPGPSAPPRPTST